MCIVIDTNVFAGVFDSKSANHLAFKPVLDWIVFGNGKIVFGGTKYREELKKANKYFRVFIELSKKRKVISVDDGRVDQLQNEIKKIVKDKKFNDPHIPAIIIVSGCSLICSGDKEAHKFFKKNELYPKNTTRPKIYSGISNTNLLIDKNIPDAYKPLIRLPKEVGLAFLQSI